MQNKKASMLNGIVGFQSDNTKSGKVYLTGDVKIKLMNVFGRAELIDFNWNNPQPRTQDLRIKINYPFIFFAIPSFKKVLTTYNFKDKAFGTDQTMSQLTREVTPLPLMICGQIYDRKSAEEALEFADIALSSKSILLNPDWVSDVHEGKELPLHKSDEAGVAYTDEPLP